MVDRVSIHLLAFSENCPIKVQIDISFPQTFILCGRWRLLSSSFIQLRDFTGVGNIRLLLQYRVIKPKVIVERLLLELGLELMAPLIKNDFFNLLPGSELPLELSIIFC